MKINQNNLIWIDLEMTGLDPDKDKILEIATVVTDNQLKVIAEGPVIAVHHSTRILDKMDEWCKHTHGLSGLIERVGSSKINTVKAEKMTLDFLRAYVTEGQSPMCGSTICQDRRFLYHYMPDLEKYFHYRNFDVSVLKMIAKRWYPHLVKKLHKKTKHQALSDVYDSIEEMKFYLRSLFITIEI